MKLLTKKLRQNLPPLGTTSSQKDPLVQCKFFLMDSSWTWYAIEFDGEDTFYGFLAGPIPALCKFSLTELKAHRGPLGFPVERDKDFEPCPLSTVQKLHT